MPSKSIRSHLRDAAYGFTSRYTPRLHRGLQSLRRPEAPVDPGTVYPSYKSFAISSTSSA
jgi:hypothetical protein